MSAGYRPPRLLASADRLDGFECRSEEQTIWLRKHARQAHARGGTSRVFVVTEVGGSDVVAYYAWCMASITPAQAPPRLRKGAGRYPQPVALLARLGVDLHHEGRGLGAALLADVISRTAQIGSKWVAGGCSSMPRARRPGRSICISSRNSSPPLPTRCTWCC